MEILSALKDVKVTLLFSSETGEQRLYFLKYLANKIGIKVPSYYLGFGHVTFYISHLNELKIIIDTDTQSTFYKESIKIPYSICMEAINNITSYIAKNKNEEALADPDIEVIEIAYMNKITIKQSEFDINAHRRIPSNTKLICITYGGHGPGIAFYGLKKKDDLYISLLNSDGSFHSVATPFNPADHKYRHVIWKDEEFFESNAHKAKEEVPKQNDQLDELVNLGRMVLSSSIVKSKIIEKAVGPIMAELFKDKK